MGKIIAGHSSLTPPGNLDQHPDNEIPAAFIVTRRRPSLIGSRGGYPLGGDFVDETSYLHCRLQSA
jgi:hypothetical protein